METALYYLQVGSLPLESHVVIQKQVKYGYLFGEEVDRVTAMRSDGGLDGRSQAMASIMRDICDLLDSQNK